MLTILSYSTISLRRIRYGWNLLLAESPQAAHVPDAQAPADAAVGRLSSGGGPGRVSLTGCPLKPTEYRPTLDLLTGSMAAFRLPSFSKTAPERGAAGFGAEEEYTCPAARSCVL